MKYLVEEFGGNADSTEADSLEEAVKGLFPDSKVYVDADGYVTVDGTPIGYAREIE